jgi:hypothetical protein
VHFPIEILGDARQDQYPSFCWLKQGGENYETTVKKIP